MCNQMKNEMKIIKTPYQNSVLNRAGTLRSNLQFKLPQFNALLQEKVVVIHRCRYD